ncbi:MAG: hypothetical protein CVV25_14445 [Ignavibacteriae bacterium HGW-Ignavibacteriae-4]|jgi:hypothetical protein|nr:MAG: hypothetical protein CVV25_14445 [Ignavibacteriae bacterium HGW-Ignavibacteriae-4]
MNVIPILAISHSSASPTMDITMGQLFLIWLLMVLPIVVIIFIGYLGYTVILFVKWKWNKHTRLVVSDLAKDREGIPQWKDEMQFIVRILLSAMNYIISFKLIEILLRMNDQTVWDFNSDVLYGTDPYMNILRFISILLMPMCFMTQLDIAILDKLNQFYFGETGKFDYLIFNRDLLLSTNKYESICYIPTRILAIIICFFIIVRWLYGF